MRGHASVDASATLRTALRIQIPPGNARIMTTQFASGAFPTALCHLGCADYTFHNLFLLLRLVPGEKSTGANEHLKRDDNNDKNSKMERQIEEAVTLMQIICAKSSQSYQVTGYRDNGIQNTDRAFIALDLFKFLVARESCHVSTSQPRTPSPLAKRRNTGLQ
jgi:hypothetical protein